MGFRESPHYRADAPGARLDTEPWAQSWPSYFAAVFGEDSSARQFIRNAWTERNPSEGGFLVPEQLRASVLSYITPAVVRPSAMVLPMASAYLNVPVLDNPSQASGGQALGGLTFSFTEDGDAIPSSAPGLARARLDARKLAALVGIPDELASDAAGALGDLTSRVVAIGYAWAEDDYFIAGTGAGEPQGILSASCAYPVTRTGNYAADAASMVAALHPAALAAGLTPGVTDVCWLVSESLLKDLLTTYLLPGGGAAASGSTVTPPDWLDLGDGHEVGPSIWGLPARVTDHQPAAGSPGDLALVDLRNYLIGDRMELTVDRSAAGSGFATDVTNYRFKARVDGRYWVPGATTTEASQTVSPVVVLQ